MGIIALMFSSCGGNPTELDVKDLEDPCDFVDAYIDNYKAQIELLDDNDGEDFDDWDKSDQKDFKKLQRIAGKKINRRLEDILEDDFDGDYEDYEEWMEEWEDCDGYDDMEDLGDDINDLIEENRGVYNSRGRSRSYDDDYNKCG